MINKLLKIKSQLLQQSLWLWPNLFSTITKIHQPKVTKTSKESVYFPYWLPLRYMACDGAWVGRLNHLSLACCRKFCFECWRKNLCVGRCLNLTFAYWRQCCHGAVLRAGIICGKVSFWGLFHLGCFWGGVRLAVEAFGGFCLLGGRVGFFHIFFEYFRNLLEVSWFRKILSVQSFSYSWSNSYIHPFHIII